MIMSLSNFLKIPAYGSPFLIIFIYLIVENVFSGFCVTVHSVHSNDFVSSLPETAFYRFFNDSSSFFSKSTLSISFFLSTGAAASSVVTAFSSP